MADYGDFGGGDYGFAGMDTSFGGTGSGLGLQGGIDTSGTVAGGIAAEHAQGLNAPAGFDISGGIGNSLGTSGYGLGGSLGLSPDYSLNALSDLNTAGMAGYGLNAWGQPSGFVANQAPVSMGYALTVPTPMGLQGTLPEVGFWDSDKGKMARSFLGLLGPIGKTINFGIDMYQGRSPVAAMLGQIPGIGPYAQTAYNAINSSNPMGYLATQGAGALGGMVGGQFAGPLGAQMGAQVLGGLASRGMQDANYGLNPFSNIDPVAAGREQAQAAMAAAATGGTPSGGTGGGIDWLKTLMSVGSGLYGMKLAGDQRALAQQAITGASPWAAGGGMGAAGDQLKAVMAGDFSKDKGFEQAQQAAARASSQQPGGFAASAAANAALKYQADRIAALSGPAGTGFSPAAGYQMALQGGQQANELASESLGSIGFGATGNKTGAQMPPWFQAYLIQNGMRG